MHDFFIKEDVNKKKYNTYLKIHPLIALNNSKEFFDVNEVEENIIKSHMYPINPFRPVYRESRIVCFCDKIVSIYEFFRYELKFTTNLLIFFILKYMSL